MRPPEITKTGCGGCWVVPVFPSQSGRSGSIWAARSAPRSPIATLRATTPAIPASAFTLMVSVRESTETRSAEPSTERFERSFRSRSYEVLEIAATDLDDRVKMAQHLFRLARLLLGPERAPIRNGSEWFNHD
jgi:hypothetical protein